MQPSEALGIAGQIAVTLAGFTGIVVVFARDGVHEWSPADRFRLRLLLLTSVVPLALSVVGLVLLVTNVRAELAWGLASGLAGFLLVGSGVTITRTFRSLQRGDFEQAGGNRILFYISGATAIAVTLLQFINAIALRTFWPFFVCIATAMLICVIQFMRLVLYRPGSKER